MFMNIYTGYDLRKFVEAVTPLVKSAHNKQIMDLLDKVDKIVKEEVGEEAVKEIDRVKELSRKELLKEWYSYYSLVNVYSCCGSRDILNMRVLKNELLDREMEREMEKVAGGCQQPLSLKEENEYIEHIKTLSDDGLLEELDFYQTVLNVGHFLVTEDHQKMYFLDCELEKRGIDREGRQNSEKSSIPLVQ